MAEQMKKITVNVPLRVLKVATRLTGRGITPTIIEGLHEIERRSKRSALRGLRGRVRLALDLEETRR
jgi:transcriptional regulator of met regulon